MKIELIAAKDDEKHRCCDANLKSHACKVSFGGSIPNNDDSVLPDVKKEILHLEALDSLRFPLGLNDNDGTVNEIDDEVVDFIVGLVHRVRVRKTHGRDMITKYGHATRLIKMNDLNLPQVRHR